MAESFQIQWRNVNPARFKATINQHFVFVGSPINQLIDQLIDQLNGYCWWLLLVVVAVGCCYCCLLLAVIDYQPVSTNISVISTATTDHRPTINHDITAAAFVHYRAFPWGHGRPSLEPPGTQKPKASLATAFARLALPWCFKGPGERFLDGH